MEPIFYRGDRQDEGFAGMRSYHPPPPPEHYRQLHRSHHHRPTPSEGASMISRHSRPAPAQQQPISQHGRGDFYPGVHRRRIAPGAGHNESNDDDGETSSASEDSAPSAGYPSPQAHAVVSTYSYRNKRPASDKEPDVPANVLLPPAQRARIQLKETESVALRGARGWSPASTGASLDGSGLGDGASGRESDMSVQQQRQLPRLAALEMRPSARVMPSSLQHNQMPHAERERGQNVRQVGLSSGPLSITPLMQLPSLCSSSMANKIRHPAQSSTSDELLSQQSSAGTSSPSVHPPMLAPPRPPSQHEQHRRALPPQDSHSGRGHHLPLPMNRQQQGNTDIYGQSAQEVSPARSWSHSHERRQVPRMESLGVAGTRSGTIATESAQAAEAAQGRWDPVRSAVPTSARGSSFEHQNSQYGAIERGYDREVHQEMSRSWQSNRQHETKAPPVAGGRWEDEAMMMQGGGRRAGWVSRAQRERQGSPAFEPRYHQHEQQLHRYVEQQPKTVLSNHRPETTRTPSPVYRAPPATNTQRSVHASAGHRVDRSEQGRWSSPQNANNVPSRLQQQKSPQHRQPEEKAGKQILQRYITYLNPKASREVWSHDEEEVLWRAQHEYGNAWSYIAGLLPGRSEHAVKNHWYTQMRMFIGQRGNNVNGSKSSTPANHNTQGKQGSSDGAVAKATRQPRSQHKQDNERSKADNKRLDIPESAVVVDSGIILTSPDSSPADSVTPSTRNPAKEQSESAARAEAVAALGMLFSQGTSNEDGGRSSAAERQSGFPATMSPQHDANERHENDREALPGFDVGTSSSI